MEGLIDDAPRFPPASLDVSIGPCSFSEPVEDLHAPRIR
jgi:hypothetical protein